MIVDLQYKCNRRQTTINLTVHMIVDLQYKCNRRQTTINLTVHMIVDLQYKCNRRQLKYNQSCFVRYSGFIKMNAKPTRLAFTTDESVIRDYLKSQRGFLYTQE